MRMTRPEDHPTRYQPRNATGPFGMSPADAGHAANAAYAAQEGTAPTAAENHAAALEAAAETCEFGGTCTEPATYVLTRKDATGTVRRVTCEEHRQPSTDHLARYVPGWGGVEFTVNPTPAEAARRRAAALEHGRLMRITAQA